MRRHQGAKFDHVDIGNVMHHKFSHDTASFTLYGENVDVLLEFELKWYCP